MNVGEYGNKLRINAKEDITGNTNLVKLISPQKYYTVKEITVANGLSVGASDVDINGEIYLAGEYVEYTFIEGDIFICGEWQTRLISNFPPGSVNKTTDYPLTFQIDP